MNPCSTNSLDFKKLTLYPSSITSSQEEDSLTITDYISEEPQTARDLKLKKTKHLLNPFLAATDFLDLLLNCLQKNPNQVTQIEKIKANLCPIAFLRTDLSQLNESLLNLRRELIDVLKSLDDGDLFQLQKAVRASIQTHIFPQFASFFNLIRLHKEVDDLDPNDKSLDTFTKYDQLCQALVNRGDADKALEVLTSYPEITGKDSILFVLCYILRNKHEISKALQAAGMITDERDRLFQISVVLEVMCEIGLAEKAFILSKDLPQGTDRSRVEIACIKESIMQNKLERAIEMLNDASLSSFRTVAIQDIAKALKKCDQEQVTSLLVRVSDLETREVLFEYLESLPFFEELEQFLINESDDS